MNSENPPAASPPQPPAGASPAAPTPPEPGRGPRPAPGGVPYHRVLSGEKRRIGRGIAALVLLLVGLFAFPLALGSVASAVEVRLGLVDPASDGNVFTPLSMGVALFSIALLLPWSMLIQRWLYKVEGASLHSVRSAFRFEVMGRALVILLPIWAVYMAVLSWLMPEGEIPWSTFDLLAMFAVVIVLAPLQSAGEEYGFRGLAFRVAASWGRGPRTALLLGVLVSSLLFMVVHLAWDPWLNIYYFVLGATMALVTWRTGGLEIAVVVHAVNNTLAFLIVVILRADLIEGMDRSVGAGSAIMLLPAAILVAITAVVWWRTRRTGPALTTPDTHPVSEPR